MTEEHPPATRPPPDLERYYLLLWYLIDEHEPVTPSTLVDRSGYSHSLVSPCLTDLKRRGYVVTDESPRDGRETLYQIDTST